MDRDYKGKKKMIKTLNKKSEFARASLGDKIFLLVGYIILAAFVLAIIGPVVYIIVASFMDPITLQNKGIVFDFSKWTLTAYERVMTNSQSTARTSGMGPSPCLRGISVWEQIPLL